MNPSNKTESILAILGRRNAQAHKQGRKFHKLFGLRLSQFWHPFTGFDIVVFDDLIQPSRNQSLHACIKAKYGRDAVQLIVDLIRP